MNVQSEVAAEADVEHFDVLIVGAGVSGISAAYHLKERLPGKRFAVIEKQETLGGTWATHQFPGIRSDSDLYTFGFGWRPWMGKMFATGAEIVSYLEEAVEEEGLTPHIRYGVALIAADWSETERRWTLTVEEGGARRRMTAQFLWMCQGYYDHEAGYMPDYPGRERFPGPVVHPQKWPADLVEEGKRFAVIGSGATAATLVPALAKAAAHVTVVQRSPTYYYPKPAEHELAAMLRPLDLPPEWFHEIMRRQALKDQQEIQVRAKAEPDAVREELLEGARAHLGNSCAIDPHFSPTYRPWRQRLAMIPEGDLYQAIRRGDASMVTGDIETFTESGIRMTDGTEVEADVIVSATGLNLQMMGGAAFSVDGKPLDFSQSFTHRAILFTGAPNLAWTFGYIRASWTLRADLVAGFICRLLTHMAEIGAEVAEPRLRPEEADMKPGPFFDPEDFNPGYITRALGDLPLGGDREPWRVSHDYHEEKVTIPAADLEDGSIVYR